MSGAAWAGISQCPTAATAVSTYLPDGCYAADLNFTNVNFTGYTTGSPPSTLPGADQVNLTGIFSSPDLPISLSFAAPTSSSGCGSGTTLFCVNGGGYPSTFDYGGGTYGGNYIQGVMLSQTTYVATIDPSKTSPPPGESYAITSLSVNAINPVNTGSYYQAQYYSGGYGPYTQEFDSILQVVVQYCVGVTSASGCTGANQGEVYYNSANGSGGNSATYFAYGPGFTYQGNSNTVNFGDTGYTQIYIRNLVEIEWVGSGTLSLDSFTTSFGQGLEAPEPSTFSLLAAGFGAIWLWRMRSRN